MTFRLKRWVVETARRRVRRDQSRGKPASVDDHTREGTPPPVSRVLIVADGDVLRASLITRFADAPVPIDTDVAMLTDELAMFAAAGRFDVVILAGSIDMARALPAVRALVACDQQPLVLVVTPDDDPAMAGNFAAAGALLCGASDDVVQEVVDTVVAAMVRRR